MIFCAAPMEPAEPEVDTGLWLVMVSRGLGFPEIKGTCLEVTVRRTIACGSLFFRAFPDLWKLPSHAKTKQFM